MLWGEFSPSRLFDGGVKAGYMNDEPMGRTSSCIKVREREREKISSTGITCCLENLVCVLASLPNRLPGDNTG